MKLCRWKHWVARQELFLIFSIHETEWNNTRDRSKTVRTVVLDLKRNTEWGVDVFVGDLDRNVGRKSVPAHDHFGNKCEAIILSNNPMKNSNICVPLTCF